MTLPGCLKKGEDDPAISLRTRKARLTGTWKIQSGTDVTSNFYYANRPEQIKRKTLIYTRTTFEEIQETENADPYVRTGPFSYEWEFRKDGGFIATMMHNHSSKQIEYGTWNFTGGVGDSKNKDQIILSIDSIKNVYFNFFIKQSGNKSDFTYYLKELRNKKLVVIMEEANQSVYPYAEYGFSRSRAFTFEQ